MVAQKIALTDLRVKALKPAEAGKRYIIWDAVQPHLGVRVTQTGHRTFLVVRRRPGDQHPIFHVLGTYPAVALAEARKQAAKALGEIVEGKHPGAVEAEQGKERERRRRDTFAAAVETFIADEKARGLRTAHETEAFLQREFLGRKRDGYGAAGKWVDGQEPIWRNLPVAEIERRTIVEQLDAIKRRGGKHAARHSLSAVRKFFNWAAEGEQFGVEVSPAVAIRDKTLGITGRDLKRKRVLDDAELRDVWQAADGLGAYGRVVQLLMLLGQRVSDIALAKWTEVDLDAGVLTVPAERFKTDTAQKVPLPPRAMTILRELPRFTGPYVFTTTGGRKPMTAGSKLKERLDAAVGEQRKQDSRETMPPWIVHDIRRTVRTRLVGDLGVEAFIAERVIGHALPGLHGVYDQGTHLGAKADALARWEARLISIVEPEAQPPEAIADLAKARRKRRQPAAA